MRYYGDRGYEISIDKIPKITENRIEGNMRFLTLTYKITRENEQSIIGAFNFSGNNFFSNAQLDALMQSRIGDIYNINVIENDLQRIADWYGDAGYLYANITNLRIPKGNIITCNITITEGDKIYLEDIIIKRNRKISVEAIREKISLVSGDVFTRKKVHDGIRSLYAMGSFSDVQVEVTPGSKKDRQVLVVTVTEY